MSRAQIDESVIKELDVCRIKSNSELENFKIENQILEVDLVERCEVQNAIFKNSKLVVKDIYKKNFTHTTFDRCALSNINFDDTSFFHVEFNDFKLLGSSFITTYFNDITFKNCILDLTNFANLQFKNVNFKSCRIIDASFNEVRFVDTSFENCNLDRTSFFETGLKGLDFSNCDFEYLQVPQKYLNGLTVNMEQAASLASSFLNIKIKN